jgi:hypothetical protein
LKPRDRIRRDRVGVLERVKRRAHGKARGRMKRAMRGKRGALEELGGSVDRDVETGFVEECDRLRRRYGLPAERCRTCGGRKRCARCTGEGGKPGLLGFSKCRECKGSGVCRGCLRVAQAVLDKLELAERYAGMRAVAGGESHDEFQALLRELGVTLEEAAMLQRIVNVASGAVPGRS